MKGVFCLVLGALMVAGVLQADFVVKDRRGVALNGIDVTSYYDSGGPVRGKRDFSWEHDGVIWRFADRDSMERFRAEPERYKPAYDGYCAWAMREGRRALGVAEAYEVYQGRLFLLCSPASLRSWQQDRDRYIRMADEAWYRQK